MREAHRPIRERAYFLDASAEFGTACACERVAERGWRLAGWRASRGCGARAAGWPEPAPARALRRLLQIVFRASISFRSWLNRPGGWVGQPGLHGTGTGASGCRANAACTWSASSAAMLSALFKRSFRFARRW